MLLAIRLSITTLCLGFAVVSIAPIAQACLPRPTEKSSFLNGRYWVGHTGQGLEVDGTRYRYDDEGGKKPWRSIKELQAIKKGVIYDGTNYWCLNTMKPKEGIGHCSKNGWVILQPSSNPAP